MAIIVNVKKNSYNPAAEVDKALRKLKRLMASEGILKNLKERRHFVKPSEMKRRKSAAARSRRNKEERMNEKGIM